LKYVAPYVSKIQVVWNYCFVIYLSAQCQCKKIFAIVDEYDYVLQYFERELGKTQWGHVEGKVAGMNIWY